MAVCVYNYGDETTDGDLIRRICGGIYDSYDLYRDSERDNLAYRMMKQNLSAEKGLVITSTVSNFGRNKTGILKELKWMLLHHPVSQIISFGVPRHCPISRHLSDRQHDKHDRIEDADQCL